MAEIRARLEFRNGYFTLNPGESVLEGIRFYFRWEDETNPQYEIRSCFDRIDRRLVRYENPFKLKFS